MRHMRRLLLPWQAGAAIVGGGNTAVEEALYLANIASSVTLIHRRDTLRAERILQERLFAHPTINIRWNSEVESIVGESNPTKVDGVVVKDCTSGTADRIAVDGVFIAIGHAPASALLDGKVELHPDGYIKVKPGTTTYKHTWPVRGRRCRGRHLPAGGDGRGIRLHGCAGG